MTRKRVILAFGTRPEATKMAPVYQAMQQVAGIEPLILLTGQHREQLQDGMRLFGLRADANLDVMVERQSLAGLASRMLPAASDMLTQLKADYVLVHGDTLTTFVVTWAAFLLQIPVGHVEAGLRSHSMSEPFPEEANRRLTDVLTDLDLAPTPLARENLLTEGKPAERVVVTGQTAVDAIAYAARVGKLPAEVTGERLVVITMHRRENWPVLRPLAEMLARVARSAPDRQFVYPVHLNPLVQEAVRPALESVSNVVLLPPLDYGAMSALLARSELIVTDSGGLQEEGASLGVPVMVLRNVTERPEGVDAGIIRLAGNDPTLAEAAIAEVLHDEGLRAQMASVFNPYGDGQAGVRVAQAVAWRLGLADRPDDWLPAAPERSRAETHVG
jgi:UDP-N-acetylglucosamine 2-epimerase (non-hydrolysing)